MRNKQPYSLHGTEAKLGVLYMDKTDRKSWRQGIQEGQFLYMRALGDGDWYYYTQPSRYSDKDGIVNK